MSLLKRIGQGGAPPQAGSPTAPASSAHPAGGEQGSKLAELRARRTDAPVGGQTTAKDGYADLKTRVQNRLLQQLDPSMDVTRTAEVRKTIEDLFETILTEENIVLSRAERKRLFDNIVAEILGFGPSRNPPRRRFHLGNYGKWREERICGTQRADRTRACDI